MRAHAAASSSASRLVRARTLGRHDVAAWSAGRSAATRTSSSTTSSTPRRRRAASTSSATSTPNTTRSPRQQRPRSTARSAQGAHPRGARDRRRDQPYIFLVHPKTFAFNKHDLGPRLDRRRRRASASRTSGPSSARRRKATQKHMILNAGTRVQAINPLYIAGAHRQLGHRAVWDRLMRVGPDGLPQPWAAESFEWRRRPTTVDVTLRAGMTWHDGQPVTVEDVIFSLRGAAMRRQGRRCTSRSSPTSTDRGGRRPDRAVHAEAAERRLRDRRRSAKINLIPKHVWEPLPDRPGSKPENAEQRSGESADRLRPLQVCRLAHSARRSSWSQRQSLGGAEDGPLDPARSSRTSRRRSACCGAARSTSSPTTPATRRC